ncbi:MAG: heme o synthase [Candidatus Caldarchaeum sp.]
MRGSPRHPSKNMKDYIRMTKPKIVLLNILTASTAHLMAGWTPASLLHLAVAGYLSVGGASAVNHYVDRDVDAKMMRTAKRPIPSGRVKPIHGLVFGCALLSMSAVYSAVFLNYPTTTFVLLGAFIYILVYTLWLKRRSIWNIVIGGAAGSCSPLAGWAASGGEITIVPMLLALIVFLWTPGHFWALAIRAAKDYQAAGIPMLPVTHGLKFSASAVLVSNVAAVISSIVIAAYVPAPVVYLAVTLPASAWLLYESIRTVHLSSIAHAWRVFKASSPWLAIVFAALILAS